MNEVSYRTRVEKERRRERTDLIIIAVSSAALIALNIIAVFW